MNARRAAARCAGIAPLRERESLNARPARYQLDRDAVTRETLGEFVP
jgi:hypothetical protein